MCSRCDYDSPDNQIYVNPLTNEYYLDIETSEWLFIRKNILRIVLIVEGSQENKKYEDRINQIEI